MSIESSVRIRMAGMLLGVFACLIPVSRAQPTLPPALESVGPASDTPAPPGVVAAPQRSLADRVAAWDVLPMAQRRERRAHYQAWRELGAEEQARLRAAATEIATFDAPRQAALRAQFAALDDLQRHGWRLGIALGAEYPALHPLLGYVPQAQRLPLLSMLRAMPAAQLADLSLLVQRTPPAERQAVRDALLALPRAQRGAWLRQRLGE